MTWVLVESKDGRSGIERYLADELKPKLGKHWPKVAPIAVNLAQMT